MRLCRYARYSVSESCPLPLKAIEVIKETHYETVPTVEIQIDFGEKDIVIDDSICRMLIFVSILSFSRQIFVKAYPVENQSAWLDGLESAFAYFGEIPFTVLSDNGRCWVTDHRRNEQPDTTASISIGDSRWS